MRLAGIALVLCIFTAACSNSGSSATPSPQTERRVTIVAENRLFDRETIRVPAGSRVTITLRNRDADPHNISVYENAAAEEELFVSETISGSGTETTDSFTAPPAGTYFFRCDVHPVTMVGDFIVE